jgi:hypothetical protein
MRFGNNVAHAGGGFASDKCYPLTAASARDRYSGTVRRAVAHWRRGVRDRAGVLVPDAPSRLASDQDVHAGGPHQWRAMHRRVAESGCWTSHPNTYPVISIVSAL